MLGTDGAHYPLTPERARRRARPRSPREFGLALVGGCCGTTPEHLRQVVERVRRPRARDRAGRGPRPGVASLYQHVPFRQDTSYLSIGERTNANGSKAFREAMLDGALGRLRRDRPRPDPRRRAPARRLRRLRRPRRRRRHAARSPAGSPPRRRCRSCSTRPSRPSSRPGSSCSAAGAVVNSVNYEDGDGPESRFARVMPIVQEHGAAVVALTHRRGGPGPHRRVEGARRHPADRRPHRPTGACSVEDIIVDCLTFPIAHRPGGDPPRRPRDDRGDPRDQAALPDGADHARRLQRVVRPQPGRPHRAQLGVPARVRQGRARLGDRARGQDPADVARSRRSSARSRSTWSTTAAARATTRCSGSSTCSRASTSPACARVPGRGARRAAAGRAAGAADHRRRAQRPRGRPRQRRCDNGKPALDIINDHLLDGMKVVGELFGSRRDAAAVRAAVGRGDEDRGRLPRAAHGEDRRGGQGHDRARHGQGRRPRHRQEPRRHHPVQQRLHRRQHRHQAAGHRDPRRRRGAPRRRRSACPACW